MRRCAGLPAGSGPCQTAAGLAMKRRRSSVDVGRRDLGRQDVGGAADQHDGHTGKECLVDVAGGRKLQVSATNFRRETFFAAFGSSAHAVASA
jgi:hypothetical protein